MKPVSIWLLAVVALSLVLLGACGDSEPEPSPSLEPGPIPTAALAPEPTETPVPDPTATPEPTSTPAPEAIPGTLRLVERASRTDLVGTVESAPCGYIEFSSAFPEYPELKEFVEILSIYDVCDHWQSGEVDPIENEPVSSDIPTLILAGELDPITSSKWGRQAVETLLNSQFIEFPGMGHGVATAADCP